MIELFQFLKPVTFILNVTIDQFQHNNKNYETILHKQRITIVKS